MSFESKNKILIVCGPTATGKTKLGLALAKKFAGEIVNADSRQVYLGMDIGTGKDIPAISNFQFLISKQFSNSKFKIGYYEIDKIKIWLLDIVKPDYQFNVADYKKCADFVIKDILNRGKLPIVVGGTGFYLKALTDEIETLGIEPDWELRKSLQDSKVSELQKKLQTFDLGRAKKMNESDWQNPRRLIRAIEIAIKTKNSKLKTQNQIIKSKFDYLIVGLFAASKILYQKIDQRVEERVQAGIENEIKSLLVKGYTWENSALGTTLAYSEWQDYLIKDKSKEEVIKKWKFDEHDYARRQMTWFKKTPNINWFDIFENNWQEKVEKLANSWYS